MAVSPTLTPYCLRPDDVAATMASDLCRHRLLEGVARLGLAVSGGADSVALFFLMLPVCRERGIGLVVLHLNHGLRAESEEEAAFVRGLADAAGVPFLTENARLADRTKTGESLEMAAREARFAFFARCRAAKNLDAIATGHHADDAAETFLLRLARGAGTRGLSGLRPLSRLRLPGGEALVVIRPLLSIADRALRGWLTQQNRGWREDASNRETTVPRNFVRNEVLPLLERTWTHDLRARICQSAEALREDDALLDALAEHALTDALRGEGLDAAALRRQPEALRRRMVRQWLFLRGARDAATRTAVLDLLDHAQRATGDWKLALSGGLLAVCRNGILTLETEPAVPDEAVLPTPGILRWGRFEIASEAGIGIEAADSGIGNAPAVCTVSAAALNGRPLRVRTRRDGDRIAPTGMDGSKKVQDVFVDGKVPEHLRDTVPLFVCGGDVVWIPGYRLARAFAVSAPDAPCIRISVRTGYGLTNHTAGQ